MPITIRTFSIHMPIGVPNKKDVSFLFDKKVRISSCNKNGTEFPRYIKGSDPVIPGQQDPGGEYRLWEIGAFPTEIQGCNTIHVTVETSQPCSLLIEVNWTTDKGDDYVARDVDVPADGLSGEDAIELNC